MAAALAPLAGVRVLDFSQVLAGPYTGRLLAELGADVIKVEAPGGDLTRLIAPRRDRGQSGLYTWANLGKRNVCIDLGRPEGRALAIDLVRASDVVLENFRPGVADRLGIGWADVHAANPRAVMVSVNGFGSDSSRRDRGAFAPTMHAATGLIEYQSRKGGAAVGPDGHVAMVNLPDARADLTTALHAAVALLAALRAAERTGVGERVEIAMYDAVLATYPETPFELLEPPEIRPEPPPYDAGPHGFVAIAGPPQHVWAVLARSGPLADPAPPGADVPTKARLRQRAIEAWMAAQPSREALLEALERARLAYAPVVTLREALTGPFGRERGLLVEVDDRRGGRRPIPRLPYRFSRAEVRARRPAPRRGEHNEAVLHELLGLGQERIGALQAAGVLLAEAPREEPPSARPEGRITDARVLPHELARRTRAVAARLGRRVSRRGAGARVVLLLALVSCAAGGPAPLPAADPRMLRATIGPGRTRLAEALYFDRAVRQAVVANGLPDYVWAPAPQELVLLFLAADRALHFGGVIGQRRLVERLEPIPDGWLDATAPDDRTEVRARRRAGAAHVGLPPGFCADPAAPRLPAACLRAPAARALLAEVRQRVDDAWRPSMPTNGGERVIARLRIAADGRLAERCALGGTSPTAAGEALQAVERAFPIAPLRGAAACMAGLPIVLRLEAAVE